MPIDRKRLWVAVAALTVVLVTVSMGRWQLSRAAQKEALQSQLQSRLAQPKVENSELTGLKGPEDWEPLTHRQAELQGVWLEEGTRYLSNRPLAGRSGFIVVTPLQLVSNGPVLLVQRGWLPRDPVQPNRIPALDTPRGVIRVQGRLALPPSRMVELGQDEPGRIRQNLDLAQFGAELSVVLAPVSLLLEGSISPTGATVSDGLVRQWPTAFPDVHKHYGYAFQWFGLSALVVVLYVWFQILVPRRRVAATRGD